MRICAPVCFLSLPSAICKLLLGWCHWAPSYLYSPCARYRELRRPPGSRLCLSVTVAFLRELHAPCISWAFPVNSLAFPERPPYVFFYIDQAMFPWGFLMGSLLHLIPWHHVEVSCINPSACVFPQSAWATSQHASVVHGINKPGTYVPICSPSSCLDLFQCIGFPCWVCVSFSRTCVPCHSVRLQTIKFPNNLTDVKNTIGLLTEGLLWSKKRT